MCLMLCTRPDIAYTTVLLSKFISQPRNEHWSAAKRILRYLGGTANTKLVFNTENEIDITAYCNTDWASSHDRKSTTGYLFYVGGNLVSWKSKKQSAVPLSSTESEIIAASETVREIMWIRNILSGFAIELATPASFCDSQPAIVIIYTGNTSARNKQTYVKNKFLSQFVTENKTSISYITATHHIADLLTKSLSSTKFNSFASKLCLSY